MHKFDYELTRHMRRYKRSIFIDRLYRAIGIISTIIIALIIIQRFI